MEHLTDETLADLLATSDERRPPRELIAHLSEGCDTCEAVLERHPALDGETDRLLVALRPAREPVLDELGWARVRRGLRTPRRVRAVAIGLGLAAALAVAVAAPRLLDRSDDGLKGSAPVVLEVMAAVKHPDGSVTRIDDGATVQSDGVLLFRYHSSATVDGSVWVQRGAGAPTRLGTVRLEAGTHELTGGSDLVGLSLEGEAGPLTVWVLGGEGPTGGLDPARLGRGDSLDVGVGRVTVQVRP